MSSYWIVVGIFYVCVCEKKHPAVQVKPFSTPSRLIILPTEEENSNNNNKTRSGPIHPKYI